MTYAVTALLYSIGGLLLGFSLGRISRRVDEVHHVVASGTGGTGGTGGPGSPGSPGSPGGSGGVGGRGGAARSRPGVARDATIGGLVVLVAVASTVAYARQTTQVDRQADQLARLTSCQVRVVDGFRDVIDRRDAQRVIAVERYAVTGDDRTYAVELARILQDNRLPTGRCGR